MAVGDPDGRRLPCPCSARRAAAARTRMVSALAGAGLAGLAALALAVLGVSGSPVQMKPAANSASLPPAGGGGSVATRVVLIIVAVLAVGAFAALQAVARSHRRHWSAFADWRTWPAGYDPWADGGEPVAGQHEGSAYRPGYGFLPDHARERSLDG